MAGVFVTGTDTGVGKTLVTAALAIRLRRLGRTVGIMKPIETGVTSSRLIQSDAARLRAAIDSEETLGAICPYQFEQPVAPLGAAHMERRSIDPRVIRQVYRLLANRYQSVVVEGIGGVRVPITADADVMDVMLGLKLPAIVVWAAPGWGGSIVPCWRSMRFTDAGSQLSRSFSIVRVLSDLRSRVFRRKTTLDVLRKQAGVPVLGPLPYVPGLTRGFRRSATRFANMSAITTLAKLVKHLLEEGG